MKSNFRSFQPPSMAPSSSSSSQFIETALSCATPYALSYPDPDQKWIIREHLLSLLSTHPNFRLYYDNFTHNDGTAVNLLKATGSITVSNSTPTIPLVIWLQENYPYTAPLVFVLPDPINPIHRHHPFVDSSGAIATPYILNWGFPGHNLSDLVRNLIKVFKIDHPFYLTFASAFSDPSYVSPREAVDRLAGMLHYDMVVINSKTQDEIEELSILQEELLWRGRDLGKLIAGLEEERGRLKQTVEEMTEYCEKLEVWVRQSNGGGDGEGEEAFEVIDGDLDNWAADLAIEDLMYGLDKAVENGVLGFQTYIRQVRNLAREQFFHRAQMIGPYHI